MKPPGIDIRLLADKLIGTPGGNGIEDIIESLSLEECEQLDSIAFECTHCNWWFSTSERQTDMLDQFVCSECA